MESKWKHFLELSRSKKIVCYGAGTNAIYMLKDTNFRPFLEKIICFLDKDSRKCGKKLTIDEVSYDICSVEQLERFFDCIVLVTLTDYTDVGKMLEERGFLWFPWTVMASDLIFDKMTIQRNDSESTMFLLNTPDYVNLGDQAIAYAEDIYLRKNFGSYYEFGTYSCHPEALNKLKQYVRPKDIIFVQGGGNIGSLWRVCEEIFRDVLKKFPENPVVVFPQSVYYGETEQEQVYFAQSQKIYNSHKNLLICTRDKRSYDFVKQSYCCECMLLPDIVLTLQTEFEVERRGIGVLLRSDKEQLLPDNYNQIVDDALKSLGQERRNLTHHPTDVISNRSERVNKILKEYASCRLIITDRLHGMIFAAITNTPCIAFDNSYHKVSSVYETWLKEYEYIMVSNPLAEGELINVIEHMLRLQNEKFVPGKFVEYFGALTEYIEKI